MRVRGVAVQPGACSAHLSGRERSDRVDQRGPADGPFDVARRGRSVPIEGSRSDDPPGRDTWVSQADRVSLRPPRHSGRRGCRRSTGRRPRQGQRRLRCWHGLPAPRYRRAVEAVAGNRLHHDPHDGALPRGVCGVPQADDVVGQPGADASDASLHSRSRLLIASSTCTHAAAVSIASARDAPTRAGRDVTTRAS